MEDLPTGFRFYPTEEELVSFYLLNQLEGQKQELHDVIPVMNLYDIEPWQLPSTDISPYASLFLFFLMVH